MIEADKNIVAFDQATSYTQGQRVELLAHNGGIGATGPPLNVRTGYTTHISDWPNNGLLATARESINIRNLADESPAAPPASAPATQAIVEASAPSHAATYSPSKRRAIASLILTPKESP